MKKLYLILLLSLEITITLLAQHSWNWITPYPEGNYPVSSCQTQGRVFYWSWPKTFLYTPDGGNSFKVKTPYSPIVDVAGSGGDVIAFADSLQGVILDEETAFKTTDGGETWDMLFTPWAFFSVIDFGSQNIGWMYGTSGFLKTTNSGNDWTGVNSPSLFNIHGSPSCIFALNEDSLWICKNYGYNGGGTICFSSDGGNYWIQQSSIFSDSSYRVNYNDIKISSSGIGLAVGQILVNDLNPHYISFIVRTSDFGNTWQQIPVDTTLYLKVALNINNDEWFIFGNNHMSAVSDFYPIRLRTTDGGLTWDYRSHIFNNNRYNTVHTAEYVKKDNILLVSAYDGIYRSSDAGNSFKRLSDKNEIWVKGFALDRYSTSENQLAVAISSGDSMIISADGGRNWKKHYINGTGIFSGDIAVAEDVIFAGINNGLYKSTDSGNSWREIYNGFYGIHRLTAYDKNRVAFLSYSGNSTFITYTTNSGVDWNSTPFSQYSENMQLMDNGKIFACGNFYDSTSNNHGFIYTSKDYGHNWRLIDTRFEMHKIRAINKNTALAISNYEVYRSIDSGESWSVVKSSNDYYKYFDNFAFKDSLNGTLKIAYELYRTSDAGLHWTKSSLSMPLWGGVDYMEYNNMGDLIVIGGNSMCIYLNQDYSPNEKNRKQETYVPSGFTLNQNYPNPFNPSTMISYSIPRNSFVHLKVFDILGNDVAELVNEQKPAGSYEVKFDAASLPSGVYFYQLTAGEFIQTKKMILLK